MKISNGVKKTMLYILIFFLIVFCFFFVGRPPQAEKITFGVNFSQKHAQGLGLSWKEAYRALIDDLGVKNIKLAAYWDLIEPEEKKFNFEDLDWQIKAAQEKGANIILVIGMKTGRWPECHIPSWAKVLTKEEQQEKISTLIEKIVLNYMGYANIIMWQVENEPLFPFGECPWTDKKFLKKETDLIKSLDASKRSIIISDSGEWSFWVQAAKIGDIVGTTMYKKVWFSQLKAYVDYPFPPVFYWRKAQIIKNLFSKKVIVVELQAEPWGPELLYSLPLLEQEKTMDLERFKSIIGFAKKTGFDEFYLWGAEWWYWMKEKENRPEIWDEARKLF